MTAPVLRDYQHATIEAVRGAMKTFKRVILQAPTGSGKSVMIAYMIARALQAGKSTWLICHRRELLDQLSETLWAAGVPHGQIMAGRNMSKDPIQVCSIQTLVRRLDRLTPPNMLAIDECHHAVANTYQKVIRWAGDAWIVGLTATPARSDGRGLGDVFQAIVPGPSVADLTAQGFLSPYRIIAPANPIDISQIHSRGGEYVTSELEMLVDQKTITGDAVDHYVRHVAPGTCLVYCVSRLHARNVTAAYRSAGIDARYVAGDTPKDEREATIKSFRSGHPPVIVSVDLFGEGLDCPGLRAVQLLRPTQSLGLHLQQVGRGLRIEKGKDSLVILDHVGNSWRHGLPDDAREWSLESKPHRRSKSDDEPLPSLRHCSECFAIFKASLPACPSCGFVYVVQGRTPDEIEGELVEFEAARHRRMRKLEERSARGMYGLVTLAVERGYKFGWAARKQKFRTNGNLRGLFKEEGDIRSEIKKREEAARIRDRAIGIKIAAEDGR